MLQTILKNRILFLSCLAFVWALILVVPYVGRMFREASVNIQIYNAGQASANINQDAEVNQVPLEDKGLRDPNEKSLEELTDYFHAGSFSQNDLCIDTVDGTVGSKPGLWKCHDSGGNQFWYIMKESSAFKNAKLCFEGPSDLRSTGDNIKLQTCNGEENQAWSYEREQLHLSGSSLCLDANLEAKLLYLAECNEFKATQKWKKKTPEGM